MNHLIDKTKFKHHGNTRLGYQGESSQQGAQKNQKSTCNHCGKIGHTSNKFWSNGKAKFNGKCYNCIHHGHRANECKEEPKFEGKCHKCKKQGHKVYECRFKTFNLAKQIVKEVFGWDHNTWCRCHYCGEFEHTGMNCVQEGKILP